MRQGLSIQSIRSPDTRYGLASVTHCLNAGLTPISSFIRLEGGSNSSPGDEGDLHWSPLSSCQCNLDQSLPQSEIHPDEDHCSG